MKKIKIFLPKRLIKQNFFKKFSLWFVCTLLLTLTFLTLSFVEGIKNSIRRNTTQNYQSHITIHKDFSTETQGTNSWWDSRQSVIEQLIVTPYVRAIEKRSSLSAYYISNEIQNPIQIIGISSRDDQVFSNFMSPDPNSSFIPQDSVYIGSKLAQKLNLEIGDEITTYIPSLNASLSNLYVSYIFQAPDKFYDNFGVYMNLDTLSNITGTAFQEYHMRFTASPFINLLISNVNPSIGSYRITYADDALEYQYQKLKEIKNEVNFWIYCAFIIIGMILYFAFYQNYSLIKKDLDAYTYQTGIINPLNPNPLFIKGVALYTFWITVSALAILSVIIIFQLPMLTQWLTESQGLFSQYNFPLPYGLRLAFPDFNFLTTLFIGYALALISCSIMILLYYILPNFTDPKNKTTYLLLGFFAFFLLNFFQSQNFLTQHAALKAIDNFWKQSFFGNITITDKDYYASEYLNLPPVPFSIDPEISRILTQQEISHIAQIKSYGTIQITGNFNSINLDTNNSENSSDDFPITIIAQTPVKQIQIIGIEGYGYPIFNDLLNDINQDFIIIGTNIAQFLGTENTIVDLTIESFNGNNKTVSLIPQRTIAIPYAEFNNTIFMPRAQLAQILDIDQDSVTMLQSDREIPLMDSLLNNPNLLVETDSPRIWALANRFLVFSIFISYCFLLLISFFLLQNIMIFFIIYRQDLLIQNYFWGVKNNLISQSWLIATMTGFISIIAVKLWNIIYLIRDIRTPKLLEIKQYTPAEINLPLDFRGSFWVSLSIIGISLLLYLTSIHKIKSLQKNYIHHHFKKNSLS